MKLFLTISICISALLFGGIGLNISGNGHAKLVETYSDNPDHHRVCGCAGWFCKARIICSDKEECDCSCGVFFCSCACYKAIGMAGHSFSAEVDETRLERIKFFEEYLTTFHSNETNVLVDRLSTLRSSVVSENLDLYFKSAKEADEIALSLSQPVKDQINSWLLKQGADVQF